MSPLCLDRVFSVRQGIAAQTCKLFLLHDVLLCLLWRYPSAPVEERKKRLKKGGKEKTFLLYASVETDINLNQILLLLVISDTLPCGRLS